ncbi:thiol-disulfide oxidoreductase DCC family protein [Peribacillus frigoritolerans]|nr:thiol-disulfide oxidoreductase DCC family protein [Peribacillus frigoritolerans]
MNPVILFDGECNFCDSSVQFIIKRDPQGLFHYASLQSEAGQELLKKYDVPADIDSMVLIERDKAYYKSSAALRICRRLQGGMEIALRFHHRPSFIRNFVYDFIARNRYKWFGKKEESCMLPSPSVRKAVFYKKNVVVGLELDLNKKKDDKRSWLFRPFHCVNVEYLHK